MSKGYTWQSKKKKKMKKKLLEQKAKRVVCLQYQTPRVARESLPKKHSKKLIKKLLSMSLKRFVFPAKKCCKRVASFFYLCVTLAS